MDDLSSWLYRYFIDPIVYDTGYNPVNTATWALVLGLSILGLIKIFRQLDLRIDERLVFYTLPYVFAGSSLRVIEDADLVTPPLKFFLITPLIYFVVFLVTMLSLLLTRKLLGREFYHVYAGIGIMWSVLNMAALAPLDFKNIWVPVAVLFLGTILTGGVYILRLGLSELRFLDDRCNLLILYAHMLDASSTYIGIEWFGYYEKHVVPTLLIGLAGTAGIMYPLKLLILLPILGMIDVYLEDRSMRNLVKLALIILGLAPAIRNTLRLTLGI